MPIAPQLEDVKTYLGSDQEWDDDAIQAALDSELSAQAAVVRFPFETLLEPLPYPADLAEALFRRVAHNLAVRNVPLGFQTTITDTNSAQFRVGGTDAEVRRLEAPYRRMSVG